MNEIAKTPKPPYYAVIFTNIRTDVEEGYEETAEQMVKLAEGQPGFLGIESVREAKTAGLGGEPSDNVGLGVTVSYWQDLESIKAWKNHGDHLRAQQTGMERWYKSYTTRICLVQREYSLDEALGSMKDRIKDTN